MAAALKVHVSLPVGDFDLAAYCARIGYGGPLQPTLATLCAFAELQPAAIPFEAIDVLLGHGVDLRAERVDAKLLHSARGGYCFELNGLLRRALVACGFEVTGVAARVRWQLPADAQTPPRSHMALVVKVDGESWLVDAGFGGATPTTPLNLRSRAPQRTAFETYRITDGPRGVVLQLLSKPGWVDVYEFDDAAQCDADYETYNWHTSTHPDSHFRRSLIVARATPQARYTLRGTRLSVKHLGKPTERWHLDADGIEQALREHFGLPVDASWRTLIERVAAGVQA